MKLKKSITMFLLIVLLVSQFNFIKFNNFVYAAEEETNNKNDNKFHYNQLKPEAKKVYNGICEMYEQGILKTGTESFDLAKDDKYVTQEQLESYMKGNNELKVAMNAARYAFYADYPEVFYIQIQKLNLRVTKDAQNRYHANIGSGNLKNYYVEGFTSQEEVEQAITDFNNKVNEIVAKAKAITAEEGKNLITEQIKCVHNEIINHAGYRLESDCTPGNEGFLGTPYGALVKQQAVCEGYARALKTVLDKLGINCILVQGTHQSEGSAAVPHMWNYVEIEKQTNTRAIEKIWYAVDATLDDPFLRKTAASPDAFPNPGDDIEEGFENTRYCLVGTETMNKEHIAIETVEAAGNYVFKYPELNVEDYGINAVTSSNGLFIKYKQDGTQTEEYKAGDYYISYNGKGYAETAKEGKYIIMKSYYYMPGDEKWDISPWGYFLPDVYAGGFRDYDDHIYLTMPNSEYVEFAVTTLAPGDYKNNPKYLAYQGNESDFVAKTEKLYNPSGTYKGPPYIKVQSPASSANLSVGPVYHVDVTYDDDLVLAQGATEIGYRMESTGSTGEAESKITNFKFDGKRRVTFDLEFSKMFADDGASYKIYVTGVVGKNSGKAPLEITYGAVNRIGCSYKMNLAKNWEVFARPTLLENEDLSMNGWQTKDGTPVSDKLKSRIALVTTKTTKTENDAMNNLMENELGNQELVTSETYNISLNVCKKYVVKTGHRLRLSLGFPAGYGPDDAGVTFKAYHFMRNDKGEVTGVEEIPCIVTQYGLIVTCDSFSPFAIAVVENDGTQVSTDKTVIVSDSEGGTITGANREEGNIITLKENESKTINIKAVEGFEIEKITVCGETIEISNKDEMNITVNYNDVKDGNCIVDAKFVAKTVVEQEEAKGEVVVQPTATPANIKSMPENKTVVENQELVIKPTIETAEEGVHTYQWYKDDVLLNGKTNPTLTIEATKLEDAGNYKLVVTTTVDTVSAETISPICKVSVVEPPKFTTSLTTTNNQVNSGEEFTVTANISDFQRIPNGIYSIGGHLEYDKNVLELKTESIEGSEVWNISGEDFNIENFKFVSDSNEAVKEGGKVFSVTFKAKENLPNSETVIKLKSVVAGTGEEFNGVAVSEDKSIPINIKEVVKAEGITSDIYEIEEGFISKIKPGTSKIQGTTVSKFKGNVKTQQDMVFTNEDGVTLNDNDIIGTGMKLKVGTLEFTLVVEGDLDGDGLITIADVARFKTHYIKKSLLTGARLKAADLDSDNRTGINDLAQIKLIYIGKKTIE